MFRKSLRPSYVVWLLSLATAACLSAALGKTVTASAAAGPDEQAKQILTTYRDKLDAIAEKLMEDETIGRDEFNEIFPAPVEKNGGTPVIVGA